MVLVKNTVFPFPHPTPFQFTSRYQPKEYIRNFGYPHSAGRKFRVSHPVNIQGFFYAKKEEKKREEEK